MNKRQKRKWSRVERLENKVAQLIAENTLLVEGMKNQNRRLTDHEQIASHNVQVTNKRFEVLESENRQLRLDLNTAIIKFNQSKKKSWFGKH